MVGQAFESREHRLTADLGRLREARDFAAAAAGDFGLGEDTGRFVPRVPVRGNMPERGRGLEFMREVMDEVEVLPASHGTTVRFSLRP